MSYLTIKYVANQIDGEYELYLDLWKEEWLFSMIYMLLLGLLMFIRFAERGTAVFYDLCVIVRVVDVYQICRERNGCVL